MSLIESCTRFSHDQLRHLILYERVIFIEASRHFSERRENFHKRGAFFEYPQRGERMARSEERLSNQRIAQ